MHEYQNKGLTEIAFRKLLILKGGFALYLKTKTRNGKPRKEVGGLQKQKRRQKAAALQNCPQYYPK
jgi:hypothetical protein